METKKSIVEGVLSVTAPRLNGMVHGSFIRWMSMVIAVGAFSDIVAKSVRRPLHYGGRSEDGIVGSLP